MNTQTVASKEYIKSKFLSINKIITKPKSLFLIAGAAAIAIIVVAFLWANETPYGVLFGNINDKDGGEIVSQLEQMKVPYKFASSGTAILVPEDKVYQTRLKLAQQGLPKSGVVGFELLDKERFGISQFSEQINYQRALEGELSRTIATLNNIEQARVHLALPKPSLFVRERKQPSASVTLTLAPGRSLSQEQINAIMHLISSSVAELPADRVTIVDQNGDLLTSEQRQGATLDTTQLQFSEKVERRIAKRIEKILTPLLGSENISVQVSADIDFSRHESTAEVYDPNHQLASQTIRSQQHSKQRQTGSNGIGGVPGALSNQPIPVSSAPIDAPKRSNLINGNDKIADKSKNRDRLPYSTQQSDTINYEVNRRATHSQIPEGNIRRLSVAVVVNYQLAKTKKAAEVDGNDETVMELQPIPGDVLREIEALAKQAMGFSADRGDSITVANIKFSDESSPTFAMTFWQHPEFYHFILTIGRYLIFIAIAWLVWSKLLKAQWMRLQHRLIESPSDDHAHAANVSNVSEDDPIERRDVRYKRIFESSMQQQKYVREMAAKDLKVTANILRNWINREHT